MTWVDLTRPLDTESERSRSLPAPTIEPLRDVGADEVNVAWLSMPTHCGTHVDAPLHVLADGDPIDEVPLSRLTGEGVVLTVDCDEARPVGPADLQGPTPRPGDCVLCWFGWDVHAGTDRYHRYPWFSPDLTDWLLDREVGLVGTDTLSPDQPRELRAATVEDPYPAHRALLGAGVPIVENLADLSTLAGQRVEVVCAPLPVRGGDGAPARVLARPLED